MADGSGTAPPLPAIGADEARALPTWRAAWSDRTAVLMAKFCELAYASPLVIRQAVQAGGFQVKAVYSAYGLQAFLAVDPDQLAVLAFRGTADLDGWCVDLDAARIALPGHPHVQVHAGFWTAWSAMAAQIRAAVDALPADLGLYVTGHSLGGALAQLAAFALGRDTLAACYSFGSPRVATLGFDELLEAPHYRVVDAWDLVPAVPPAWPGGYAHSGDPRLLSGARRALRRDRGLAARTLVELWGLVLWPLTRRLAGVDDHMIWNYRRRLETIEAAEPGG